MNKLRKLSLVAFAVPLLAGGVATDARAQCGTLTGAVQLSAKIVAVPCTVGLICRAASRFNDWIAKEDIQLRFTLQLLEGLGISLVALYAIDYYKAE